LMGLRFVSDTPAPAVIAGVWRSGFDSAGELFFCRPVLGGREEH